MGRKKKFGNKTYYHVTSYRKKGAAKALAKDIRTLPNGRARVTKERTEDYGTQYYVWTTNPKPISVSNLGFDVKHLIKSQLKGLKHPGWLYEE